ncbi:MAG: hypothetical protein ORN51_00470 [Akkermansiaceae bacterium]|nr:hypothetical protein [Akkermansiaceae bacterium]
MNQQHPRLVWGFQLEVGIKIFGIGLIPFAAGIIGANRQQPTDPDFFQTIRTVIFLGGGLAFLLALPYFFIFHTPKCDSCKVRTKKFGRLVCDGEEFTTVICPQCRERFRYSSFNGPDLP